MSLTGKVIVITGASSGIGEALAVMCAKEGARVCLGARRVEKLEAVRQRIMDAGGECAVRATDVVDRAQMAALVAAAEEAFGPVDVLVNNAGVMPLSFMKHLHQDEWDLMIDVNVKGVLNGIAAVLPSMLERDAGDIVNISSDAGRKLFPSGTVYCATKWAVEAITQGLRNETKGTKIRVTSVQPGATTSELCNSITDKSVFDMFAEDPLDRLLDADDVARAVVYALQQPAHCAINEVLVRST
eukprot:CAMPEP_0114616952 /NCGR_PEP_ID=MMETSP0168-20121206/6949_1 /TAXON_ID=95228 ORGANISM="Vannella sp., Strain DIVA3 517/6/12" /NCGR_SAMPLE_ID=MMETSP0168 /ASSEMBLY_ACC=CAM_ASM_000044 /LENGTH=242 /DNA_ID=CAMNT_0001828077 /DNA_START=17 /DNA_END=741 /DNA_ORIENTATION=-